MSLTTNHDPHPKSKTKQKTLQKRDVQLESFSVSNGGVPLIEDAHLTLTAGRRYGLVGRNGTGACVLRVCAFC